MKTGVKRYCYESKKIFNVCVSKEKGLMVLDFVFHRLVGFLKTGLKRES